MTHRRRKRQAFTLIELLVTMAIASVIMGIGVAAYIGINKSLAWHASVSAVTSLLQAARNSASQTRTAVSVIIRTEPTEIPNRSACIQVYATFMKRIGAWHFEEPNTPFVADTLIEGAFSQKATPIEMTGSGLVGGKYGKAIRLERWIDGAEVNPPQKLVIGKKLPSGRFRKIPVYDVREGLRISAWVKPELPPDVQPDSYYYYPIVAKPLQQDASRSDPATLPVYSMTLMLDTAADERVFKLLAGVQAVQPQGLNNGTNAEAESLLEVETKPLVRPDTWTHVAMVYSGADTGADRNFIRVFINDEEIVEGRGLEARLVDHEPFDAPSAMGRVAVSDEPAMIGADGITGDGDAGYFHGTIDEVMIDAITTAERAAPSGSVLMRFWNCQVQQDGAGKKYRIDFDREGRLVMPQGGLPVIALFSSGSKVATLIGVELTGAIKTWNITIITKSKTETEDEKIETEVEQWMGAGP